MKYFLYAIVIFGYFLLPIYATLTGGDVEYDAEASDPRLLLFRIASFVIVLFFYIRSILKENSYYYSIGFIIFLLFVADFAIEFTFLSGDFHTLALYSFEVFIVYSIPGIFMAIDMARDCGSLGKVFKYIHLLMYVVSLGSIVAIPKTLANGTFLMGDASYQEFSYSSALCFGINFFGLLIKNDVIFDVFKTKIAIRLSILLLPIQAICVFLGAGRGGAVLLIVTIIVLVAIKNRIEGKRIISLFLKLTLFAVIIVNFLVFILQLYPDLNEQIFHFDRVFEYISDSGGIDMEGSSGRDYLYKYALGQISESPLWGYGIFRSYGFYGKLHNMILDVLLAGGLLLFSIIVVLFGRLFVKMYKMCLYNNNYICLVPLMLYPFIMLQFSGSYLFTQLFWFVIIYVLMVKYRKDSLLFNVVKIYKI